MSNQNVTVNRKYKDSVFRNLFGKNKKNERIYSKYLVRIPNPKYIVFYNGSEKSMEGDTKKLRLSDSFQSPDDSGEFEWTATKGCGRLYQKQHFERIFSTGKEGGDQRGTY